MNLRKLIATIYIATACFVSQAMASARIDIGQLQSHLSWCMRIHTSEPGQQGIVTYVPGTDQFRSVVALKREFSWCQSHNPEALRLIQFSTEYEFVKALDRAIPQIEDFVKSHMHWVAYNKNRAIDLLSAAEHGEANRIRAIYMEEQAGNPEARSNIKGVSDLFLLSLASTL